MDDPEDMDDSEDMDESEVINNPEEIDNWLPQGLIYAVGGYDGNSRQCLSSVEVRVGV